MKNIAINKYSLYYLVLLLVAFGLSSCATTPQSPTTTTAITGTPPVHHVYEATPRPAHLRSAVYHSVAPGETLWRISKMYDVDPEVIKEANKIRNERDIDIGKKLYIPNAAPRKNVITLYPSKKWKYIIIHHSATDYGNSAEFNEAHKKRGWRGIGYHFVIDNGTCGKADGQIETSPRWLKQMNGAHCKAGNMNSRGIGICLVGNLSDDMLSEDQMNSLVYLVNTLRKYYKIPKRNIMGHGQVSGAKTECPGKRFPWKRFWRSL